MLKPDFGRDFGAPYWVVHRADLHKALLDRASGLGAEVLVDSRVVDIDFEKGHVTTVSCWRESRAETTTEVNC